MKHGLMNATVLKDMLYRALDGSDDLVAVLEQAGDGVDGLVIAATNDAFCRASGHTATDLIGRPFRTLAIPEADPETWQAALRSARDRQPFRSELLCSHANGRSFWLGLHIMPVPTTTPSCSVLLGRDITAGLREKQQHAAIQGLLAKVFTCVQAPVAILEEHGFVVMTNPALDRLLGHAPGVLVGKPALSLAAPGSRSALLEARQRQLASGQSYTLDIQLQRADGSEVRVEMASILVEGEDLKRFRILTLTSAPGRSPAPPLVVHIAGKIKLIGLEEIKASLGSRWTKVATRAMQTAEHIVRQSCGPRDSWSRTADSGFVITFADATEEEAALRATTIARDIRARLIGEGELSSTAYVSAVTAAVDDLPDQPGRSPDALAEALAQRLSARLAEIEERARATLREAASTMVCELSALRSRQRLEIAGHIATLPRVMGQNVERALSVLPGRERETFDFDRLVLGAAAEQVIEQMGGGSSLPVLVAVDFELFLDRRCMERYVAALQVLDRRLQQHLILVLSNLPHGVPRNRVQECVMRLRPFCQMVAFQADGLHLPPVEPSLLSASIVTLREKDLNRWANDDLTKLGKLIEVSHTQLARVLVRHVGSLDNAKRLLRMGVDLIAMENDGATRQAA
jgi:PAS domain S-box-containing protein